MEVPRVFDKVSGIKTATMAEKASGRIREGEGGDSGMVSS